MSETLAWSDAFLLGYGPMDDTHRDFVECANSLVQAPDTQLLAMLDLFIVHAREHFGTEDQWMTSTAFPPRDCHMDEHAAVLQSAQDVRLLLLAGNPQPVREFAAELVRWFPGHADYLDSALAQWMFKRQHGGKPVVLKRGMAQAER